MQHVHTKWLSSHVHVLSRCYSSKKLNGGDFLNELKQSFSAPPKKKKTMSSDFLKNITSRPTTKSSNPKDKRSQGANLIQNKFSARPQGNSSRMPNLNSEPQMYQPKPKPQDIFANFDPTTFKYRGSLSERENEFYTEMLKQVFEINPRFNVLAIGGDKSPERMKIKTFMSRLQDDEAFDIVDVQQIDDVKFPLVRALNKQAALKTFSDKRAAEVTKLFGRTHEKKRGGNVKFIKVSWEISQSDLENQKTNEILAQLKKGYKLTIAIDTKDNLQNSRYAFEEGDAGSGKELNNLEMLRRERAFEYVKKLLEENGTVDYTGSVQGKIIMNVAPNISKNNSQEKKATKDQKKMDRAAKQKKREEEKKARLEAKAKMLEETLSRLS